MKKREVSKETLKAMASMLGLEFSDEKLEGLLPQIKRSVDFMDELDLLDLKDAEPATVFNADSE